jgi:hypothetical protein
VIPVPAKILFGGNLGGDFGGGLGGDFGGDFGGVPLKLMKIGISSEPERAPTKTRLEAISVVCH